MWDLTIAYSRRKFDLEKGMFVRNSNLKIERVM
jgi:hypothetical protein